MSQREALHQGKGLRLKLRIQSTELAALPWEFLYDMSQAEYVCLSSNTPIVRYLELPRPPQPLTVKPPLSILGMIASAKSLANLDIELEKQRVERAIEDLRTNGLVELTWLKGRTSHDLQRAMRGGPWHIFHFIGHGGFDSNTDEGLIALEDDEGQVDYLSATHLGRLLADHRFLRLVVLNSCEGARGSIHDIFSSTAAILVRRGIPAVLAMQYEIIDRAAITLSKVFYEALADGTPVDMAVSEARKAISIGAGNSVEWGTPVLYTRAPDGFLFDLIQKSSGQPDQLNTVTTRSNLSPLPSTVESTENAVISDLSIRDFFISYTSSDRLWAEWIAWQLEETGYSTFLQSWDFRPGSNFVLEMHKATQKTKRTIAVLSPHYLNARFTQSEWATAFQRDPRGEEGILLPVRVQECKPEGLLGPIVYIDLVGLDESIAREKLLVDVRPGRGKATTPPVFPEKVSRSITQKPTFPAEDSHAITPRDRRELSSDKALEEASQTKVSQTVLSQSQQPTERIAPLDEMALPMKAVSLVVPAEATMQSLQSPQSALTTRSNDMLGPTEAVVADIPPSQPAPSKKPKEERSPRKQVQPPKISTGPLPASESQAIAYLPTPSELEATTQSLPQQIQMQVPSSKETILTKIKEKMRSEMSAMKLLTRIIFNVVGICILFVISLFISRIPGYWVLSIGDYDASLIATWISLSFFYTLFLWSFSEY